MRKLVLSENESQELLKDGSVEIERNGFPMVVSKNIYYDETKEVCWYNQKYDVVIINVYDKVVLKEKKS